MFGGSSLTKDVWRKAVQNLPLLGDHHGKPKPGGQKEWQRKRSPAGDKITLEVFLTRGVKTSIRSTCRLYRYYQNQENSTSIDWVLF